MNQKIEKSEWRVTLDKASKSLSGQRAEVEIAALVLVIKSPPNGCQS